ncbi:nucleotidyltransferase family protein [Deinococcus soli (ex Cha et al. 2016)]|uniref:Uncharacterized protein n=2 Tax=Deinococcus soli (ex Cha et al. 2016) TaxID=1309411 RepID=A0ACC6KNE7_9DEIO|nr:nucleotidyltransferase family protein [Deinococcus soli (ex Cha et al. 2016)]MDR6220870.1 hypothetical protein [Deinococcus soli (ex Cha et al. 2016)]MDR6330864.1 hypothetical protein [Deinococcus soli (ex Cha et al. 2016)]MDR6753969.1 hypothetical protein [Deinococcus soli (ex Cha et al. 2016)]
MPASPLSLVGADPALTPADLAAARALHLEGHLDTRLPRDHALRPHLRGAALGQGTRHQIIARELRDLLRTWQAEAIPCLLTKGFALAEFEYPSPAARYYGDVDVVLSGDQAAVTRASGRMRPRTCSVPVVTPALTCTASSSAGRLAASAAPARSRGRSGSAADPRAGRR